MIEHIKDECSSTLFTFFTHNFSVSHYTTKLPIMKFTSFTYLILSIALTVASPVAEPELQKRGCGTAGSSCPALCKSYYEPGARVNCNSSYVSGFDDSCLNEYGR